ncbi:MAG TPA: nuclear transport factor 2 family protein [Phenylobacterium sp.]|nr:nuclear transport factor 2 family protein [Phenylobacterium sp.]
MQAAQIDDDATLAAIRDLETRRCALISEGDLAGLSALLSDDYLHVHATGRIDGKSDALASFARAPRRCWRGDFTVRLIGDTAVVVGPQVNLMPRAAGAVEEVVLTVTTVLQRGDDGWRLVSFHGCRLG